MIQGIWSRIVNRMGRRVIQAAVDTRVGQELNAILVNYKIQPREKEIFPSEQVMQQHLSGGYSDDLLNEYIIAKSTRWLQDVDISTYCLPPHVCNLLWILQIVFARIGRPMQVLDFGGGAPTMPVLLGQLGQGDKLANYVIVESPAFVRKAPQEWGQFCTYTDTYDGQSCDLLILSSVLPYLPKLLVQSIYQSVRKNPPRYIYFARTSFLADDYPADEAFTIQESRFRDHGAQVDVGMADIENNMARYSKRHFKWAEVAAILEPLNYRRVLSHSDESGLENIKGLSLYSNNALYERAP